jgi:SAM-dependent methyltransferase
MTAGAAMGEAIPLADQSADLVFMSMVFHHFDDPRLVAQECYRVLHDEGVVFLPAGTVEQIPAYPYVAFFPSTPSILEQRLPTNGSFVRRSRSSDFGHSPLGSSPNGSRQIMLRTQRNWRQAATRC